MIYRLKFVFKCYILYYMHLLRWYLNATCWFVAFDVL